MQSTTQRRGRSSERTRGFGGDRSQKRSSSPSSSSPRSSSHPRSTSRTKGGRPQRSHNSRPQRRNNSKRVMKTFDPTRFIHTNPVDVVQEIYTPKHQFNQFGLQEKLVVTVAHLGMETPSPIQDQIIPEILQGHDVIGVAETGTGKTAAFLLPLIEKTIHDNTRQTLIVTPTRELAIQVKNELDKLARGCNIFSTVCVGGANIRNQINSLRRQNQFIIGTPGRLLDLMDRRHFAPKNVKTVVLDEADRMLDMGFIHPIKSILSETPRERETLLFSATMDARTQELARDFMKNPVMVSVKKKDVTDGIKQDIVPYEPHTKFETLAQLLSDEKAFNRVIIFGTMKHSVEKLAQQLSQNGIKAESLHGNKNHSQRQRSLKNFKDGHSRVLVATNVAARGIHVDDVSHVINYDLPDTFEDYVHRIGRTGRGSSKGQALTFIPKGRS